ncbi:hypothetical protein F4678DRAFT_341006 [Xylaria arbuscula]|nr:hypothetical protein F4678DRAFT_341006 [Xylaria arbuscula]
MTLAPDASTPVFRGKDATRVTNQSPNKEDKDTAENIKGIRFLFWWCIISQIFSIYRAYEIYQGSYGWDSLSSKNKIPLAWAVVGTVLMALFTPGYVVLEYRRFRKGGNGQVV